MIMRYRRQLLDLIDGDYDSEKLGEYLSTRQFPTYRRHIPVDNKLMWEEEMADNLEGMMVHLGVNKSNVIEREGYMAASYAWDLVRGLNPVFTVKNRKNKRKRKI